MLNFSTVRKYPILNTIDKLDFIYESINKVPATIVYLTLFKYMNDDKFNSIERNINESIGLDINVNIPMLSLKEFNMGLNKSLPKYLFITESAKYLNGDELLLSVVSNIDDAAFAAFKHEINESYVKIYEKARDGRGSLKELVDKTPNEELTPQDAINIGKHIANMEGYDKKKYIGMVNYLGTTCMVFDAIKTSYLSTKKTVIKKKTKKRFKPDRVNSGGESLKHLVNKNLKDTLTLYDGEKIGKMVALMQKKDRRDFVGMINFLGASCHIHQAIINAYMDELQKIKDEKANGKSKNTSNVNKPKGNQPIKKQSNIQKTNKAIDSYNNMMSNFRKNLKKPEK